MKKWLSLFLVLALLLTAVSAMAEDTSAASDKESIEAALNLANNPDQEWTYNSGADAWVL